MNGTLGDLVSARMHGAGNSFVIVDERVPSGLAYADLARRLCAVEPGFDVDGMLVLERGIRSPWRMRIFNRDGAEAEMCGNGIRCVVRYLFEAGEIDGTCAIETLAGTIDCQVTATSPVFEVRVDLGEIRFPNAARAESPAAGPPLAFVRVDVGNPHAVVFCDDVSAIDLAALAARLAGDERFPNGTNVHVAQRLGLHELRVRHFERGVGETAACGTGAVAAAVVAVSAGLTASPVDVFVPGGRLRVDWEPEGHAYLTGPAEWERGALVPG